MIVWGERLWRTPARSRPCSPAPAPSASPSKLGPGLLEVPEAANGRGLREVGCLPGAGPGLKTAKAGASADEIRERSRPASSPRSCSPTPTRSATYPDSAPAGARR